LVFNSCSAALTLARSLTNLRLSSEKASPELFLSSFLLIANNHIPGITNFTLKKLLNHSESDVTAGHIQFEVENLRRPMQMIEDFILEQAGIKNKRTAKKL